MVDDELKASKSEEEAEGTQELDADALARKPATRGVPADDGYHASRDRRVIVALVLAVIATLIVSNILLWTSLSSTKDDLSSAERRVRRLDSLAGSALTGVADRLEALEVQLGDVGSGAEDVSGRVEEIELGLDDLRSCVNAYLEGFDAANGGFFTFSFC